MKPIDTYERRDAICDVHMIYHPPTDRKEWAERAIKSVTSQRANLYVYTGLTGDIASVRWHGFQVGKLPIVACIDSDDEWLPHTVERSVEELTSRPDVVATFSHLHQRDEEGRLREVWKKNPWTPFEQLTVSYFKLHPHFSYRSVVSLYLDDMERHKNLEEWALWSFVTQSGDLHRIDEPLAIFTNRFPKPGEPLSGGRLATSEDRKRCLQEITGPLMRAHAAGRRQID